MSVARTALIVTSFNRPSLVQECLRSVLAQTDRDMHVIVMDDGSSDETRAAIVATLNAAHREHLVVSADSLMSQWNYDNGFSISVHWLQPRSMESRRSFIPYSATINKALNHLLFDDPRYIMYLCDDDVLTPNGIKDRADYLDAHPDVHVCYGHLRSVQYDASGQPNTWTQSAKATPVTADFVPPTGLRQLIHNGKAAKVYYDPFHDGAFCDPDTGLPYVEEGCWFANPIHYGVECAPDHNMAGHRRECLTRCRQWPDGAVYGGQQYWGEDNRWGVGDARFFELLGEAHPFHGIDSWVISKRYHAKSWGSPDTEIRE